MHKFLYYILPLLLMLAGATSCSSDDGPDAPPEPSVSVSRTVLVYMIANNNLGRLDRKSTRLNSSHT